MLAEKATALLPIPAPEPHLGPNPDQAIVHKPLYLWVTDPGTGATPGQLTSGVSLRGVTVNAVAKLTTTDWDMGEPVDTPTNMRQQRHATTTCTGPGTQPATDKTTEPTSCSYSYHWKSTCARTSNNGTWPVTARTTWRITWTSNVGVSGTTTLQTTGTTTIEIGELRGVLVNNPDATLPTPTRDC